jgi:hypothetical protein
LNPFLASGIILILRWLQFIAAQQVFQADKTVNPDIWQKFDEMLEDTKRFSDRFSQYCIASHSMADSDGKQVN